MIFGLDFHAHLPLRPGGLGELLAAMDEAGIARAVVVPGGSVTPLELSRGIVGSVERDIAIDNLGLRDGCAKAGDRLIPFYFGNPHRSPWSYSGAGPEFRGLKLGPAVHGVPLLDSRNLAWVEAAQERRQPIYLHCLAQAGFDVPELVSLAQRYPRGQFVLGHAGVGNADFRAVALIARQSNIHFETSGGFSAVISFAVAQLGADRVLFGSEFPFQDPSVEALKLRRLGLSPGQLEQVTHTNGLRLLGLERRSEARTARA